MEPDEIKDPSFEVVEDETDEQRQERYGRQTANAEDIIIALGNENQWNCLQSLRTALFRTMDSMVDGYRNRGCADDYLLAGDELVCPLEKGEQII